MKSTDETSQLGDSNTVESKTRTISKDILLLVLGAVISLMSSLFTTIFASNSEDTKLKTQQKLAFSDDLSKYLALKYYVVGNLGQARIDNDSALIKKWQKKYESFDTLTVSKTYYYPAHLRILFGKEFEKRYIDSIRSPLDTLEVYLTQKPVKLFDDKKGDQCDNIDYTMHRFTVDIYGEVFH